MRYIRPALIVAGGLGLAWGGWLLLSTQSVDQLLSVVLWLVAVVVVHDGLLAAISAAHHRRAGRRSRPAEPDERTS
ncbi:hypothetical protein [Microbacterium sp. MYb62]|uniref:hypothetical protein n=1 Tax=Microbacterium sp. MYb62 TaxID=1848690 RepID=UPI000CFC36CB|nr:hypothetical protein [Microbacterium sp. MYb62]PRB19189.1 hypothetical protein CQ042_01955 [Microbacterium sp. MYb62]